MRASGTVNMCKHKVALIDSLKELESINVKIVNEHDPAKKARLKYVQGTNIKQVKSLISHLNSIGKLNDKETKSLLSLDLYNVKDLKMKYRIGG